MKMSRVLFVKWNINVLFSVYATFTSSPRALGGRLQRTSCIWGGGGFEILDVTGGRRWFVKIWSSENCWDN